MRRTIKLLLCFLLVAATLCGCSGRRTLSNLAVVEGMSIDRAANGVSVSVQTLNMTKSRQRLGGPVRQYYHQYRRERRWYFPGAV